MHRAKSGTYLSANANNLSSHDHYSSADCECCCVVGFRETLESRVNMMHHSSSEHESVGSRDTGIDLNPDDVPVGYHASVDRLSSHRRRSRSVVTSRSAAADSSPPPVIDADDEADDPSVVSSRRSASRSASFDKTMEWLITCTKCSPDQFTDPCDAPLSHVHDSQGFNDAAADADIPDNAECGETSAPQEPLCKAHSRSQCSSPARSVCHPHSESAADDDEGRPMLSSDNLSIGLRHRRAADTSAAAADHVVGSDAADRRRRLEVQSSRQTLMSSVDSETGVRSSRRAKQKVLLHHLIWLIAHFLIQLNCKHASLHEYRVSSLTSCCERDFFVYASSIDII